jgi:predicted transcriptional regulator
MRIIWGSDRPLTSRGVWIEVNKGFEGTGSISRASIINFLNAMCDEGILTYGDETGRGGYHRMYSPGLGEEGFKLHVAREVISKLLETWSCLQEYKNG